LSATPFGTLAAVDKIQREVQLHYATLRFTGALFDALIPALAERASTVVDLARRPLLASFGADEIRESLLHLVLAGPALPMTCTTPPVKANEKSLYRLPLPYNRMILEQRISTKDPIVLAVPTSGMGLVVPVLEAILLRLMTEVHPSA